MKITHISDTHNRHNQIKNKLPGGDLLIHSGDFTSIGRKHEIENFIEWFDVQPYTHKVFIAGNHDLTFQSEILFQNKSRHFDFQIYENGEKGKPNWLVNFLKNLPKGIHYLENNSIEFDGIKIWGSPYSPSFGYGWAFNADRGYDINCYWETIPLDTDIVVTHTPIYGYNDRTANTNENVGCADLYHKLKDVKPDLHFCGHIHEGYGYKETNWGYTFNGSICNLQYNAVNNPITFDFDFKTKELHFL